MFLKHSLFIRKSVADKNEKMKKIILIGLLISTYSFASAQDMKGMDMSKKESKKKVQSTTYYTCVMHPQVKKDKPGNCPICGMKLVKKTIKPSPKKTAAAKQDGMKMPKDTVPARKDMKDMDMKEDMNHRMDMPVNDHKMNMPARPSGGDSSEMDAANQIAAKVNFQKGKTVRYDLYVKDTLVNFTG